MDRDGWVRVATGTNVGGRAAGSGVRRRVFVWVGLAAVAAIVAVVLLGNAAAERLAESDAVSDAARIADITGVGVVAPLVTDALLDGDPAARTELEEVVRKSVLRNGAVRVKIWDADGTIVFSDEERLIGQRFELDEDEREALAGTVVQAEPTDVDEPENVHERAFGRLLEAYRPVTTPGGTTVLFEEYFRYDVVGERAASLRRGFGAVTIGSVLLLALLLAPLVIRLAVLLRRGRAERTELLTHALEASDTERRRIAAGLHDGVVQDLAGTSFVLTGALSRVDEPVRTELGAAGGTVRASIAALRTLLVDIYPSSLARAGLTAALDDATALLRSHGVDVRVAVDESTIRTEAQQQLVFRVVQEALRNVARHARATSVDVRVVRDGGAAIAEVSDDGVGFDVPTMLASPPTGHFGLRVLRDTVGASGAVLDVRSRPGGGTAWRLRWAP
ncbi:sensor histidine kinase [Curtobacterium sp. Leaf261]|uniref:sensor histidine kinase n=1 Tax=Curtobacterium sp. Leaf261 TaxID=1736311 RepID=UPI0006F54A23|nr:histidine kinase [Curtobacterium sp. Leaf261]KQO63802.1 hypothetical protein ASF23_06240 [Curtobacterium sp. Leaf261]